MCEESGTAIHPSILKTGCALESTSCDKLHLGCLLCPRFTTKSEDTAWRHMYAHIRNAVQFQDTIFCRCNLRCRDTGHYHCLYCPRTLLRKEDTTNHLTACQARTLAKSAPQSLPQSAPQSPPQSAPQSAPQSPPQSAPQSPPQSAPQSAPQSPPQSAPQSAPQSPPQSHSEPPLEADSESDPESNPDSPPDSPPEPHPPLGTLPDCIASVVGADHSYTLSASAGLQSPAEAPRSPPEGGKPRASPAEAAMLTSVAAESDTMGLLLSSRLPRLKSVKCPDCSIVLYKKNLLVHQRRRHARPYITAATHPPLSDTRCTADNLNNC